MTKEERAINDASCLIGRVERNISKGNIDELYELKTCLCDLGDEIADGISKSYINSLVEEYGIMESFDTLLNDKGLNDFERNLIVRAKEKINEII